VIGSVEQAPVAGCLYEQSAIGGAADGEAVVVGHLCVQAEADVGRAAPVAAQLVGGNVGGGAADVAGYTHIGLVRLHAQPQLVAVFGNAWYSCRQQEGYR